MAALEGQCTEEAAPRDMMVETDDFSSVILDGRFDIRALGAQLAAEIEERRQVTTFGDCATGELVDIEAPGRVSYGADGGLVITIAPGALKG